ncbi:SMP-30/gluconolactonase/LRE family protein [Tropicibacter sp. Alg240-R139]|uniref:SMP-30/gluconolactonase/LRE family protein n=1 Tax=Tropicibacter sp. Alg240-R139 TaxID=2305991 RepID=UPI0013E0E392|nr:SMP-30/gluconolactonase/LRE family protein [Tropicibacter sp. Alg240-R139]
MSLDLELHLEEVAGPSDIGFPEGPVAMNDGSLLFVDIEKETLSKVTSDGTIRTVAEIPGGPNGVAIGPDSAAYVCNNGGVYTFKEVPVPGGTANVPWPSRPNYTGGSIQRVDLSNGNVTTLYPSPWSKEKLLAPDDIVFDKEGGFWFTDSGYQDEDVQYKGALYYGTIDGQPLKKVATIPMANGVGLSPDGKTVYVSDTIFSRLWALDIKGPGEVEPGPLPDMPGRIVQSLPVHQSIYQWLDSLKVEASGKVCVGTIFNGGITVFEPNDGTFEHVPIPALFVTNFCFGGTDMQDLWITASSSRKIYKARWPRKGLNLAFTA